MLGKTPQAIGAAVELLKENKVKKILVVPPASLKYQWKNEIEKFTDYEGIVIDGAKAKRRKQYKEFTESDIPFCISNYETVRGDIELFKEMEIDCIVLKLIEALHSNM